MSDTAPTTDQPETGTTGDITLPDGHPLLKTLQAQKDTIRDLKAELKSVQSTTGALENAVQAAREEGRIEGRREAGSAAVASEFRAAFAGRAFDVDAYLEGVDVTRFVDDEGSPKTDAITALAAKLAPAPTPTSTAFVQQTPSTPTALNGDPLLAALKTSLGISE